MIDWLSHGSHILQNIWFKYNKPSIWIFNKRFEGERKSGKVIPEMKLYSQSKNINNSHDNYSFLAELIYVNMSREN